MSEKIKEYDKNNNLIYYKNTSGFERWYKYDENNNEVYYRSSGSFEEWRKYDEENRILYYKNFDKIEDDKKEKWYKYDKYGQVSITEQEFERIEKRKLFLNNKKSNRFELMDI